MALMDVEQGRIDALLASGRASYGQAFMRIGDRLSERWLRRSANPYRDEIAAVAARVDLPGAYFLNLSHEWACTTGVAPDPERRGNRMLRTLDWTLPGLGRNLIVTHQAGPAGPFYSVTWPGFAGVATGLAPGRFSAAFNQAPMRRRGLPLTLDWSLNRISFWRSDALPPAHLLRQVFEMCETFAEAKARLVESPLCLPTIFVLSGTCAGEGCVVERLEDEAIVHDSPVCVANHWLNRRFRGDDRGTDSHARHAWMGDLHGRVPAGPDWLIPPIINETTRLAAIANAACGTLWVQGYETYGPATAPLELSQGARYGGPTPLTAEHRAV